MDIRFTIFGGISCFMCLVFAAPVLQIAGPGPTVNYIDGDIVRTPSSSRNYWSAPKFRWPNGRIPYIMSSKYSAPHIVIIMDAMEEWEEKTCVVFVPKEPSDSDYVEITPEDGTASYCYSHVGRQGGRQVMKMFGECLRPAAMVHELGHVIGFNHEHQRPDRDDFIDVYFKNINPAYHFAFVQYERDTLDTLITPYDYSSVMQYPFYAFTEVFDPKRPAMTLKNGSIEEIYREAQELSPVDILKAELYYNNCTGGLNDSIPNSFFLFNSI